MLQYLSFTKEVPSMGIESFKFRDKKTHILIEVTHGPAFLSKNGMITLIQLSKRGIPASFNMDLQIAEEKGAAEYYSSKFNITIEEWNNIMAQLKEKLMVAVI